MNKNNHPVTNIRDNIPVIPYFKSKGLEFPFLTWSYTGELIDYEEPYETCELCGKHGLRYHFVIHDFEGNKLWVGSECINRFGVPVYDEDNNQFFGKDGKKILNRQINRKQLTKIRNKSLCCLRELYKAVHEKEDKLFIKDIGICHKGRHIKKHNIVLKPDEMLKMLNLLKIFNIEYTSSWFKVSCNKKEEQIEFSLLKEDDKKKLRQFASKKQVSKFFGSNPKVFKECEIDAFLLNRRKTSILKCLEDLANSCYNKKNKGFVEDIREKYKKKRKDKEVVILTRPQMRYMVGLLNKFSVCYKDEWFKLRE